MTEKTTTLPSYKEIINNGQYNFLQKIETQEITDEKTGERTVDYVLNKNTGGHFVIHDKDSSVSGTMFIYHNPIINKEKLYIVDKENEEVISQISLDNMTINDLRKKYSIKYVDKNLQEQDVFIEDENNIQTDNKGMVLSFDKIDSKNPNGELYLKGIYDGEFKEVTKEVIDPETNKKTTETKKFLTGYANIFYQNGNICIQGSLENGNLTQGKLYREDGTLWPKGDFILNEQGFIVLHGNNCIEYYEDGKTPKCIGTFENGLFKQGKYYRKDGTLWSKGDFILNEQGFIVLHGNNCKEYYEDGKTVKHKGIFKDGQYILNKNGKITIDKTFLFISTETIKALLPSGIEFKTFYEPLNSDHLNNLNGQPSVIMICDKNGTQHTVFYDGKKIHDSWYNCFFNPSPLQDYAQYYYSNDIINNKDKFFFEKAPQQNSNEGYCVLFSLVNAYLYNENKLNNSNKILQNIEMIQILNKIADIKNNIDFHINGEEIKTIVA